MDEKILLLPIEPRVLSRASIFAIISFVSFFIPFFIGHPQWVVGAIVNAGLFLSAIFFSKKYFLPIAIFPSLGVLARGLVFGPFTPLLIYFLPFVWLGNIILIQIFLFLFSVNKEGVYFYSVFFASAVKFVFLFLIANIYFKLSIVPALFLQTMGLNQLATALAGGLLSFLIFKLYGKFISRIKRAG